MVLVCNVLSTILITLLLIKKQSDGCLTNSVCQQKSFIYEEATILVDFIMGLCFKMWIF